MAFPSNSLDANLTAINSITRKYFFPQLVDQVITSNALRMELKRRGNMTSISGGDDLRQPVRFARGVQQNYSGAEVLTTNGATASCVSPSPSSTPVRNWPLASVFPTAPPMMLLLSSGVTVTSMS